MQGSGGIEYDQDGQRYDTASSCEPKSNQHMTIKDQRRSSRATKNTPSFKGKDKSLDEDRNIYNQSRTGSTDQGEKKVRSSSLKKTKKIQSRKHSKQVNLDSQLNSGKLTL